MLVRQNINIKDCRIQAYDGVSTMQREAKGGSAVIKKEQRQVDSFISVE